MPDGKKSLLIFAETGLYSTLKFLKKALAIHLTIRNQPNSKLLPNGTAFSARTYKIRYIPQDTHPLSLFSSPPWLLSSPPPPPSPLIPSPSPTSHDITPAPPPSSPPPTTTFPTFPTFPTSPHRFPQHLPYPPKMHRRSVRRAAKAPAKAKRTIAKRSKAKKATKRSAQPVVKRDAETQSSLLLAAVEKAVEESLQLSSCRGEAKNDLFDSIVDLLTETFLRDLTASRTLAPSHPLDLPARDESVQPTSTSEPPTNCAPIASPIDEMPARNNRPSALAPRKAISKRVGNRTLRPRGAWRKARVVLPSNIPDAEPVEKNEEIDEPSAKKNSDVSEKGTAKRQGARVTRSMGASVVDDHIVEIEESIVDSGRPRRKHAPTKPPRSATRSARRKRPAEDAIDLRGRKKHQKVHKGKAPKKESTLPSDSRPLSSGEMACERVTRSTSISPYADEECEIEESIVDSGRPRRKNLVVRNDKRKSKPSKAVVRDPDPASPNITDETEQVRKQRLPWWMTPDSDAKRVDQSEDREKLFTGFTMAVIRSCVRESWSADALKESFDSDPSSARGQAFSAVSSTMLLLEQARHMGQCYLNWSPRIIRALNHYRVVEWSVIEPEASFDQFVGCELCRGHRAATCRLVLKGPCYDSCDFWPGSSRIEVLSAEEDRAGIASVAVELEGGTTNDHLINVNISEGQDELWLDPQCLRKCLLFHQLVHATSIMADELRGMVEDELREGMVQLDESDDENVSLPERLERTLVQALSVNASFLQKRTSFLEDIVQLGYLYFADKQVESDDDSGLRGAGRASIYDDPIELNDTKYRSCIDELVRQSHIRANGEPYATF